jgi:hypothetical protein
MEEWPQIAANILHKQSRTPDKFGPPASGLGEVLTTPHHKIGLVGKRIYVPRVWTNLEERHTQWKRDVRFRTWNVKSLYRSGSLSTIASELTRHKLDLEGVQTVK